MARRRKKQTLEDMIIEFTIKSMMAMVFFLVFNYVIIGKYGGKMIGGAWLNPLLIVLIALMAAGLGIYLANIKLKLERANIHEIDKMSSVEEIPSVPQSPANDDLYVCATCGKPVTNKVKEYCLFQPKRFNNRIYCYEHQRRSS